MARNVLHGSMIRSLSASASPTIKMSTVRPATFTILLFTLASACQLGEGGDDGSTLRGKRAIGPSAGPTDEGADGWDVASIAEEPVGLEDLSDGGDSTTDGSMDDDCFWTGPNGMTLGSAANYAILAKSGIGTVPVSTVIGNLGLSPGVGSSISGFGLTMANTNDYATSLSVIGNIYAADYKAPTPANLAAAIVDMEIAYNDAASRMPDVTGLGAGNIGGMTLPPGVYNWDAALSISSDISLHGCGRDVWIFQIGGDLIMSKKASIDLLGGADAGNVFWKVGGKADIGAGAHFEGNLMTKGAAIMRTEASIVGRLLAQTKVSLANNTVIVPE
jgi:hypothetical protein